MKKIFYILVCISATFFFSCTSTKNSDKVEIQNSSNSARHSERSEGEESQEDFSHNTIIVSLQNGTTNEEIAELAARHNLNVLYIYKNFSSCALSSPKTLTDSELDSLISEVQKDEKVLAVQKDYIMHLD